MRAILPGSKLLRKEFGCICYASELVHSWRDGRVDPDEMLETEDGEALTFRQLCIRDDYMHEMVGLLPELKPQKERSWREERRFRKDIWRRVVNDGDYVGFSALYGRIDERDGRIAALSAANLEAENAKRVLEKQVAYSKSALATANASLTVARRTAEAAEKARKLAAGQAKAAQHAAGEALKGKRLAEHVLDVRGRKDAAAKERTADSIGRHLKPEAGTFTICGPSGIPDAILIESIRRWARDVAPADVLAICVGKWFGVGAAGIIVTAEGVVGTGLNMGIPIRLRWGKLTPLSVTGSLCSAAEVLAGGIVLARFPAHVLNAGRIRRFIHALAAIEAELGEGK